ncbi:MAG: hypothetical protein K5945_11440 [Bacteroidaceae bacterium]|nr:hypothetical protein [Bacteroidaceae bacterium]
MAENSEFVQCLNCKWGTYQQWFENPVIATCSLNNEKQVAATRRICKEYRERLGEPQILHHDSYD